MRVDRTRVQQRVDLSWRLHYPLMLLLVLACSDAVGPREPLASGPFVAALSARTAAPELETYISLPPGSIPGGYQATLRIVKSGMAVTVPLIEGGFDPVRLPATDGETVEISVVTATGTLSRYTVVPRRSRPTIVRTSPPKGKRDVALNARVGVIFSEPIDPATLTAASVQLLHEGSVVPGEIVVLDSAGLVIEFRPAGILDASSEYELVLTGAIRDLQGATLQPVSISFETGTALAAAVATVTVSPSDVMVEVAQTSILTAIMLDAANTVLSGRTVTWTSSDPTIATVKPYTPTTQAYPALAAFGVVTGVAAGGPVTITATSEGKSASVIVTVMPLPSASSSGSVTISVTTAGTEFGPSSHAARVVRNGTTVASMAVALSGSTTSSDIPAGSWILMLDTSENCTVSNARRHITVTAGDTIAVAFDVQCRAPGQLAFVRSEQIFLANTNGTGVVQLTTTGHNADPAWSPDGTRIAFASDRGGRWDIYVMNADGSNPVALTSTGHNVEPSWSPDGRHVAFTTARNNRFADVYAVSVAGGSETALATDLGYDAQPAWSPGGTIAFVSDRHVYDFTFDLYAMNADGSNVAELIVGPWPAPLTYYFQPAWSPDGSRIAVNECPYAWDDCFPVSTVMVANADGSGLRAVANGGGYSHPTWSPDGSTLAFSRTTCRTCPVSLHYARVDGTQEGTILTDGRSPSWRPSP